MAQKGITLYSVGCEPALKPYKEFFTSIAYTTGGQYVPLRNANLLSKVIVGGAVEEISLDKLLEDAQREVDQQTALGITDERLLTEAVEKSLKSKGVRTRQIRLNNSNLDKASNEAIKYSKLSSMAEMKKEYKLSEPDMNHPTLYSSAMPMYDAPRVMMCSAAPLRMMKRSLKSEAVALKEHDLAPPEFATLNINEAAAAHVEEIYTVADDDINYQQSERLVQKILNRKK